MTPLADNPVIVPDRELEEEKRHEPFGPRIRCPLCGWSPAKKTSGSASAGMSGTRSTREASAQPAFTTGLKPNVSRAADGHLILVYVVVQ